MTVERRPVGYKDNMAFVAILSTPLWHQQFIERGPRPWDHGAVARTVSEEPA